MLKVEGAQYVRTYIYRRQVIVAQWVAFWTIFEVCAQQATGYEDKPRGRGKRQQMLNIGQR